MHLTSAALVAICGFLLPTPVSSQNHWYTATWKDFSFDKTGLDIVTDFDGLEWRLLQPQGCCSSLEGQPKIRDAKFRVSLEQCKAYCVTLGFERCKGIQREPPSILPKPNCYSEEGCCTREPGYNYNLNDLNHKFNNKAVPDGIKGDKQCETYCLEVKQCIFWTHIYGKCFIKDSMSGRQDIEGAGLYMVSGACLPTPVTFTPILVPDPETGITTRINVDEESTDPNAVSSDFFYTAGKLYKFFAPVLNEKETIVTGGKFVDIRFTFEGDTEGWEIDYTTGLMTGSFPAPPADQNPKTFVINLVAWDKMRESQTIETFLLNVSSPVFTPVPFTDIDGYTLRNGDDSDNIDPNRLDSEYWYIAEQQSYKIFGPVLNPELTEVTGGTFEDITFSLTGDTAGWAVDETTGDMAGAWPYLDEGANPSTFVMQLVAMDFAGSTAVVEVFTMNVKNPEFNPAVTKDEDGNPVRGEHCRVDNCHEDGGVVDPHQKEESEYWYLAGELHSYKVLGPLLDEAMTTVTKGTFEDITFSLTGDSAGWAVNETTGDMAGAWPYLDEGANPSTFVMQLVATDARGLTKEIEVFTMNVKNPEFNPVLVVDDETGLTDRKGTADDSVDPNALGSDFFYLSVPELHSYKFFGPVLDLDKTTLTAGTFEDITFSLTGDTAGWAVDETTGDMAGAWPYLDEDANPSTFVMQLVAMDARGLTKEIEVFTMNVKNPEFNPVPVKNENGLILRSGADDNSVDPAVLDSSWWFTAGPLHAYMFYGPLLNATLTTVTKGTFEDIAFSLTGDTAGWTVDEKTGDMAGSWVFLPEEMNPSTFVMQLVATDARGETAVVEIFTMNVRNPVFTPYKIPDPDTGVTIRKGADEDSIDPNTLDSDYFFFSVPELHSYKIFGPVLDPRPQFTILTAGTFEDIRFSLTGDSDGWAVDDLTGDMAGAWPYLDEERNPSTYVMKLVATDARGDTAVVEVFTFNVRNPEFLPKLVETDSGLPVRTGSDGATDPRSKSSEDWYLTGQPYKFYPPVINGSLTTVTLGTPDEVTYKLTGQSDGWSVDYGSGVMVGEWPHLDELETPAEYVMQLVAMDARGREAVIEEFTMIVRNPSTTTTTVTTTTISSTTSSATSTTTTVSSTTSTTGTFTSTTLSSTTITASTTTTRSSTTTTGTFSTTTVSSTTTSFTITTTSITSTSVTRTSTTTTISSTTITTTTITGTTTTNTKSTTTKSTTTGSTTTTTTTGTSTTLTSTTVTSTSITTTTTITSTTRTGTSTTRTSTTRTSTATTTTGTSTTNTRTTITRTSVTYTRTTKTTTTPTSTTTQSTTTKTATTKTSTTNTYTTKTSTTKTATSTTATGTSRTTTLSTTTVTSTTLTTTTETKTTSTDTTKTTVTTITRTTTKTTTTLSSTTDTSTTATKSTTTLTTTSTATVTSRTGTDTSTTDTSTTNTLTSITATSTTVTTTTQSTTTFSATTTTTTSTMTSTSASTTTTATPTSTTFTGTSTTASLTTTTATATSTSKTGTTRTTTTTTTETTATGSTTTVTSTTITSTTLTSTTDTKTSSTVTTATDTTATETKTTATPTTLTATTATTATGTTTTSTTTTATTRTTSTRTISSTSMTSTTVTSTTVTSTTQTYSTSTETPVAVLAGSNASSAPDDNSWVGIFIGVVVGALLLVLAFVYLKSARSAAGASAVVAGGGDKVVYVGATPANYAPGPAYSLQQPQQMILPQHYAYPEWEYEYDSYYNEPYQPMAGERRIGFLNRSLNTEI